jgi:hypothetical protein
MSKDNLKYKLWNKNINSYDIMLSEISQDKKDKYYMFSFMFGI